MQKDHAGDHYDQQQDERSGMASDDIVHRKEDAEHDDGRTQIVGEIINKYRQHDPEKQDRQASSE